MTPRDPYDLIGTEKNIVSELQKLRRQIRSAYRQNVRVGALAEIAAFGGPMSDTMFGESFLNEEGIHTSADLVYIDWWLPLNLSYDSVTDVRALLFDGTEYVYVGGTFTKIGGISASNIARYSIITRNWEEVGGGVNGAVYALAFDSSDVLHIGGAFTDAGGDASADGVAKLSGSTWVNVGAGISGAVLSIAFDSSDVLHIGGAFLNASGVASADYIAKMSGGAWTNLGGGLNQVVNVIGFDAAGVLYAGGEFTAAGGDADANYIASFSSGTWSNVGGGVDSYVTSLGFDNNGVLYIGGSFTGKIARLSGGAWETVGGGVDSYVNTIKFDADGILYAGGSFASAFDSVPNTSRIAKWDGAVWSGLSTAGGLDGYVYAILPMANGSIMAGGSFNEAGSILCQGIALLCKPISEAIDLLGSLFELYAATHPLWATSEPAPTTSDISAAVWTRYYVNLLGLTADRNFILPAPTAVNEEIELYISNGNNTYELIIKGDTGITINGGSAATEWSRLFITDEVIKLVSSSLTNWQVSYDGRIPCKAVFERTGSNANTTHSAATDTKADWNSLPLDIGNMGDLTNDRAKIRRAGQYQCGGGYAPAAAISDLKYFNIIVYKNGTGGTRVLSAANRQSASGSSSIAGVSISPKTVQCAADDYLEYFFKTEDANRGLLATDYAGSGYEILKSVVFFSVTEILR